MAEGFIFDHNLCVACNACTAACIIENGWPFRARRIYSSASNAASGLPPVNISLACNHCANPVCMEGCPSAAYSRDESGAVVIDDTKCLGCKYCQWNCPYNAPQYIVKEHVIGKCNLCSGRLAEGLLPACSTACPTGALGYGQIAGRKPSEVIPWFPEKNLEPSLLFTGRIMKPPTIIPGDAFEPEPPLPTEDRPALKEDWSLVAFSFLTILSVSRTISALMAGVFPDMIGSLALAVLAALLSLSHLGQWKRSWQVLANLKNSPLSREIALFMLYVLFLTLALFMHLPFMLIVSSLTGLLLAVAIDAVYIFADRRRYVYLHSGQAFITVLLMVSFFTGRLLPFIFIAALKLIASVISMQSDRGRVYYFPLRFFRIALLIIAATGMFPALPSDHYITLYIFLAGEILDRILFYIDFKPLNINNSG